MNSLRWLGCAIGVCAAASASANDYYVASEGTGDYTASSPGGDLQYAVENLAKNSGDVVYIGPGTYVLADRQYSSLSPAAGVSLVGTSGNPADTIIQGTGKVRVCYAAKSNGFRNLTLRGGASQWQGGGICGDRTCSWATTFVVSNCVVENCSASYQGGGGNAGIWYDSIVRNCQTTGSSEGPSNTESYGGGVYGGRFYRCAITGNVSKVRGGGVSGGGTSLYQSAHRSAMWQLEAHDCEIAYNTAPKGGGVGAYDSNACRLFNCDVHDNECSNEGGGLYFAIASNCVVRQNSASIRGGGSAYSALTDCLVCTNTSKYGGGGVYCGSVTNSVIRGNQVTSAYSSDANCNGGGGVRGALLVNCRVLDNTSNLYGGGTMHGTNVACTVEGNSGTIGGGAFCTRCERCLLLRNTSSGDQGGAGYNCETYDCLVVSNVTASCGTLCRGYHQGDVLLDNSFQRNGTGGEGREFNGTGNSANSCVVVNCTVLKGPGVTDLTNSSYPAISQAAITNVLVWGYNVDVGYMRSASHSFWKMGTGPADAVNCIIGDDPRLQPYTDGSYTNRAGLTMGSPCFDAGLSLPWMRKAKDMAGTKRIRGSSVDIGALEGTFPIGTLIMCR